MLYFKDSFGRVFAYDSKEDRDQWGGQDLIEMSDLEVDNHLKLNKADIPTKEEAIIFEEILWRNSQLNLADVELNKVQDSDPKAVGSVDDWRQYRKELRAWPDHKDFPNKKARPKAPHLDKE